MIKSAKDFGRLVRQARKQKGLTQAQLAERSGTSLRFIISLEQGKPTCVLEKSIMAAIAAGVELGDLNKARPEVSHSHDDREDDEDLSYLPKF